MLRPTSKHLTDENLETIKGAQFVACMVETNQNGNGAPELQAADSIARIEIMIAGLVVFASLDAARTEDRDALLSHELSNGRMRIVDYLDNLSAAFNRLDARIESVGKRFGL